ncbi:MAG TPA: glutamate--tRNA ligase [Spirochaetota bacterium]|nr:glutamate--tRNA ligase [Spirochaetota bacterium]
MSQIRVRFAPSPTGYLHIGGLRTALFNYLFARKTGGAFILRLEDTDRTRLVPDALDDIMRCMRWLGIDWDEGPDKGGAYGPYTQSERLALYQKHAQDLLDSGHAYRCFCTPERLEAMREAQKSDTRYDGHCRSLPQAEVQRLMDAGLPSVVRLKVPTAGETVVHDFLRGEMRFDNRLQDDLVLLKTDGFPTYHLANIVDDHHMKISHVLRGEEWISSAPKHVMLYDAFGWTPPVFVHLPVILSPNGGKLSKRDGATNVREFIEIGYLPEAMTNFLALLGWSYDGERSMFTMEELEKEFVLEKIGMASPVFDRLKLDDYNGKYIRLCDDAKLADLCRPRLEAAGFIVPGDPEDERILGEIMPLFRERLVLLSDIVDQAAYFFTDDLDWGDGSLMVPKKTEPGDVLRILDLAHKRLSLLDEYTHAGLEAALRSLVEELAMKAGQVFMPLRVAVTSRAVSPGLFETMAVLGKERCLERIVRAREVLAAHRL